MCGVFVDLQKFFDTVHHEILVEQLNRYGIRSKENNCFRPLITGKSTRE